MSINSASALQRVVSLNYPVRVSLVAPEHRMAIVSLKSNVDRELVPSHDFVLYIRDEGFSQPSATATWTKTGMQAVSVSLVPKLGPLESKASVERRSSYSLDTEPGIRYSCSKETKRHDFLVNLKKQSVAEGGTHSDEGFCEFIFFIDRSHRMDARFEEAKKTLGLLIQSLPRRCRFGVWSFGSSFFKMFDQRSVEYNNESLLSAVSELALFGANLGDAELYAPLKAFETIERPTDCSESHLVLLSGGSIGGSTKLVLDLIARLCASRTRLHVLDFSSRSSSLLRQCALVGRGHCTSTDLDAADAAVSIIARPVPNYKILQKLLLFDATGSNVAASF